MSLLSAVDVAKFFGSRAVFEHVSFTLSAGEKVALVGRNGVGKTTLLKVLSGELDADAGRTHFARSSRFALLSQDTEYYSARTVYEEMRDAFADLIALHDDVRSLEAAMSDTEVHDDAQRLASVMDEYSKKSDEFERMGGYMIDSRIRSVVFGLGFAEDSLARPVNSFSGGERVRLRLAKLLLSEPSLLFLDEPTNHLDLHATEWLEEYIRDFPGAVLIVSHDRYFLDIVAQKVVELEAERATVYSGNYSAYVLQKEERRIAQGITNERQQAEIARLQAFVDKWKSGTKSTLAKSREKMLSRIEPVGAPKFEARSAHIRFAASTRSGKEVVRISGISKTFGDRRLFEPFTAVVERGDRVAIIGPNGAGKSTLLKMIMGMEETSAGGAELGYEVSVGYFSQSLSELDPTRTVIEEVEACCGLLRERVRTILGALLFTGDEVFKPVRVLSGGERNRVVLAKLLVGGANLLVLDEPTNHLDIRAKDALESALVEYNGTVLLVSHDRYFLDHIATKIFDLEADTVTVFRGNYSEYRLYQAAKAEADKAEKAGHARLQAVKAGESGPGSRGRPPKDTASRDRKRSLARLDEVEKTIAEAEAALAQLEAELGDPELYADADRSRAVARDHKLCQERLVSLFAEWEEAVRASEQD